MSRIADRVLHFVDRAWNDGPEQQSDEQRERCVVEEDADASRDAAPLQGLDAGRIAAAMVKAKKSSAGRIFSFQSASAATTTARTTALATNARRAVSPTIGGFAAWRDRKPAGNRRVDGERRRVLANADEEICLEARRHGIVLARPLAWALVLASLGGVLVTLPWPVSVVGAVAVAFGAAVALRAVWKWERTRLVVTPEKVFVVDGTWRRRARSVRLGAVEAVELQQSLPGRLLGYGTVVVGTLALDHVPRARHVYRLVERLAA